MDGQDVDQDFSKLNLEDRLTHKNWKARVSGYEELAKLFPTFEDKEFQRYSPLIKKFVIDSNAAAQEKALAAVLAYVDYCPVAGKYVDSIISGIATKCLASTRVKTKELAGDIVLMCVEIERQDVVVEELVKALEQKTPKNVAATISMMRRCLNLFGYKVISVKPIVPTLAKLLEGRDPGVREEAKQLTIEIYRWVKDALVPQLSSLKPILLQELTTEFEKVKGEKAVPERLLRSQQQREELEDVPDAQGGGGGGEAEAGDAVDEDIDPFELMEAVDILHKLPADFFTQIEAKKWQERKDCLEKLQQLLESNPKLAPNADYNELMKHIKRIIAKDTNIVVATSAIKCLALMANGLRKNFHSYASSSVGVVLEKFKEKKANVVQALREAIDAVFVSTSFDATIEDLTAALDNKNPNIRSETALFLARTFAKTNPHLINKKLLKQLVTSLLKTLSDSDAVVRESSAEALGTALKAQGDRNMGPLLQGLENLKMAKIEEYKAKVEVKKFPMVAAPPAEKPTAGTAKPRPVPRKPAASSSRMAKAAPTNSSMESLDLDLPPPKPEVKKPAASAKYGQVRSRLNADSGSSSLKSGTVTRRPGTVARSAKTGSSSNVASLASGPSSSSMKKQEDTANAVLMTGNSKPKDQRNADERALKVLKWNFTTPREEFYVQLKEQMSAADWNAQLVTFCYHSDFKYHIKAIDLIRDFFVKNNSNVDILNANIDLILKWVALRFFDTNPSVIMKALELLLVLFKQCEDFSYSLTDQEANSFLPYLVLKVGDPKDLVRNKVHEILVRMRNLHPANKIFAHLFAGLQSKNSRQRATCLEEIASLIELKGMAIFQQPNSIQAIKEIARFIAERDNGVRNGALSCIVQVYFLEGEKLFKMVGNLSDKEMSLVEERIKRASKNRPPPTASDKPVESSAPTAQPSSSSNLPSSRLQYGTPESGRSSSQLRAPMEPAVNEQGNFALGSRLLSQPNLRPGGLDGGSGISYETISKSRSGSHLLKRFAPQQQQPLKSQPVNRINSPAEMRNVDYSSDNTNGMSSDTTANTNGQYSEPYSNGNFTTDVDESDELEMKVKEALSLPELRITRRLRQGKIMSDLGSPGSPVRPNAELESKFNSIFTQLSSAEIQPAFSALEYLNYALKEHQKFNVYLDPKVDKLIYLCNKQYRLFLTKHYPTEGSSDETVEAKRKQAEMLFRANTNVLNKLFTCPLGKCASRDTLRELITHLLPYFVEMKDHTNIFNSVNQVLLVLLNGSDPTSLSTALIKMLHDYVGNTTTTGQSPHSDKFLELTMKFLWRMSKFMERYISDLNVDTILLESHNFFKSYPRSWWRVNNRDDLPLRTIKTLIYLIVQQKGDSILEHFTLIKNKDESELSYYIQKALRQCEQVDKQNSSTGSRRQNQSNSSNVSAMVVNTPTTTGKQNGNHGSHSKENFGLGGQSNIPRATGKCFPLQTRQYNSEDGTSHTIPVFQCEQDLKAYVDYTAKQIEIPLSYDNICSKPVQVKSVEDAERAVQQAQERLLKFKSFLERDPQV